MAYLYIRVSTSDQNPEMQIKALQKYCNERGIVIKEVFKDIGSGANDERPEFKKLVEKIKNHKNKNQKLMLGVWKLDRLSRSTVSLLNILDMMRKNNVEFFSVQENLDTSTQLGKVLFQLVSIFAEFERETIRGRVMEGLKNARKNGKKLGRPRVGIDYARLIKLKNNGDSIRQIANQLNISHGSVLNYLKDCPKKVS